MLFIIITIDHHSVVDEFLDSRAEAKRASEQRMAHLRLVDEKRDRDREGSCDQGNMQLTRGAWIDDDDDDRYE